MTPEILTQLQDALDEAIEEKDLEHADNFRFGDSTDPTSMAAYGDIADKGCCGSFESEVKIEGKTYFVGCDYGH